MIWPFRRDEETSGMHGDATQEIVGWVQRTFGEADYGLTPVFGLVDSPTGVDGITAESPDWLPDLSDAAQGGSDQVFSEQLEIAQDPAGDGPRPEPGIILVVITTPQPDASEGKAHIFADADEARGFVERLIDEGFDRECIKTIRGGPAHFNLYFRAVVDWD